MPPTVEELLAPRLPGRLADVITLMRGVGTALPRGDGVACFNRLYLAVTEAVHAAVQPGRYRDPRFVRWLDVVFANLFFRALREAGRRPSAVPKAWAPLVEARARRGVAPLQFALAGMNAHINRDLPLALVETWKALGLDPRRADAQHEDFSRLSSLLAEVEATIKLEFATGILADVDRSLGNVDDVVAMWNVHRAREAAWVNAETLWALQSLPALGDEFVLALDRMVGFAGRGILRPLVVA